MCIVSYNLRVFFFFLLNKTVLMFFINHVRLYLFFLNPFFRLKFLDVLEGLHLYRSVFPNFF